MLTPKYTASATLTGVGGGELVIAPADTSLSVALIPFMRGDTGQDGAQGIQGPKGDKGDTGQDGAQGQLLARTKKVEEKNERTHNHCTGVY